MNGLFGWELFCLSLRLQSQTADSEYMVLPHCALGALPDIRDETFEIHQRLMTRVDVPCAAAVHDEDVVRARSTREIDVFSQFDHAFGAHDHKPPVAPGRQTRRA